VVYFWNKKILRLILFQKPLHLVHGGETMKSVKVKGMSCQHCVIAVTKTLTSLDGIKNVEVDLQNGVVTYQEDQPVAFEKVAEAIRKAGYEIDG